MEVIISSEETDKEYLIEIVIYVYNATIKLCLFILSTYHLFYLTIA